MPKHRRRTRTPARKRATLPPRICNVPDCGRRAYAKGRCQTHHQHVRTKGTPRPIHPYRTRVPGTVKFAGLRLSPQCAEQLQRLSQQRGLSMGAAIADVLQDALVKRAARDMAYANPASSEMSAITLIAMASERDIAGSFGLFSISLESRERPWAERVPSLREP